MSVDWPGVKTAIVEFAKVTNVIADDVQIHWEEEAKPHMRGDYLWLNIRDEKSVGWDDVEDVLYTDVDGSRWIPRVTGIREFTVDFEFRSRSSKGARAARNALEVIRASLHNPVRRAVLDEAGVAFLAAEPISLDVGESRQHDQRLESIAKLPIQFRVLSTLFETGVAEAAQHVEAIELALTVDHEGADDIETTISETGDDTMPLSDLVSVNIEVTANTVAQQGFGIPLILAHHTVHPESRVLTYNWAGWSAAMLADNHHVDSPAYRCAEQMAKQKRKGATFKVGRRVNAETQVVRITPSVIGGTGTHKVTVQHPDGTEEIATYAEDGSGTIAEICTGWATNINALSAAVTATGVSGTHIQITADAADRIFGFYNMLTTDALTDESTGNGTVGSDSIATDLSAILDEDDDWYGVCLASASPTAIEAVADWTESNKRIFYGATHDSRPLTIATTDIVSSIMNQGYVRSHVAYSSRATRYFGAGLTTKMLSYKPGQATWMFKTVEGSEPDKLTATQWGYLKAKNGSYYDRIKGVQMSGDSKTGGGQYLDITQIVDWTEARLQEGFVAMLTGAPKVAYTDAAAGNKSMGVMRNVITEGQANDAIDLDPETWSAFVPKIKDIPEADRAIRKLSGLQTNFRATGAVHSVDVSVNITAF